MSIGLGENDLNTVFIFIAIAVIILLIVLKPQKSKFWINQPVMLKNDNYIEGVISRLPRFTIDFPNKKYYIRINEEPSNINSFLNSNFSKNYNMDNNMVKHILNKHNTTGVTLYHGKKTIGFISSFPVSINYKNSILNYQFVDFLCIEKLYRDRNIAPILIAQLINQFSDPYTIFLFKIEGSRLPFRHMFKGHYFIKDLGKVKPNIVKSISELSVYNFYKIHHLVNGLFDRYKFHRKYSKSEFLDIFMEKKLLKLYVVRNKSKMDSIIIGKKTIYTINHKEYVCFEIDHILGECKYAKSVISRFAAYAKYFEYSYITISTIGSNYNFIKAGNFKKGNTFYYYTYNQKIEPMYNDEFCFNIN